MTDDQTTRFVTAQVLEHVLEPSGSKAFLKERIGATVDEAKRANLTKVLEMINR